MAEQAIKCGCGQNKTAFHCCDCYPRLCKCVLDSDISAEADELMREMADAICLYATAETATQARAASDELIRMHKKLQEQANDRLHD